MTAVFERRYVNIHLISTKEVLDYKACTECQCEEVKDVPQEERRGGVVCCRDCPSRSLAGATSYALEYTTVYRYVCSSCHGCCRTPA